MIEVDYLLTTSAGFLEHIAAQLSSGYGEKVRVENSQLLFPPGLASGRFAYYNLEADLSMSLLDCTFHEEIRFKRLPLMINYFQALSFNLSTISLMIERHDYSGIHLGEGWKNKILYSSSERGLGWTAPKGSPIRMVVLYFTRSWMQRYYKVDAIPTGLPYAVELMQDKPLQFSLDLDLELLMMMQEILSSPAPRYMYNLYYEGCAKKLIACVATRMISPASSGSTLRYQEVTRIMDAINQLETRLEAPPPPLEELALTCCMSRSKFEKLFKAIFGTNLTDYLLDLRMKKAAVLLQEDIPILEVARQVGYNTSNHFTKVFRSYYRTTPKVYKDAHRSIPSGNQ